MNHSTAQETPISPADQAPFPPRLILAGILLVLLFLISFTAWSILAPIESAVVSRGIVSVASHRKQIQHLEGGIVDSIHVRDGDKVSKGQLLVKLSDVQPAAKLRQLDMQSIETQVVIARLQTELKDVETLVLPKDLLKRISEPNIRALIEDQQNILNSRRSLAQDQSSVSERKIAQAEEEIIGLRNQIAAKNKQKSLLLEEIGTVEEALAKQLVPKAALLKLRRSLAELDSEQSAYQADIAKLEQSILEMRLQQNEMRAEFVAQLTAELRSQRAKLFDLSQKTLAARDVLQRTDIVSPIDGVVVNLQVYTQDGVVAAGQPILEVVPTEDDLIIYAHIHPDDVDEVAVGMPADVRLTSISRRSREPLEGIVKDLSADRLTDPDSGQDYYRARIELIPGTESFSRANLMAGMGADVFIRTGARTALDYLLSPITRNLQYGLREY